jgi:hypothetical protein
MVETRIAPRYRVSKAATIESGDGATEARSATCRLPEPRSQCRTKPGFLRNSRWLCPPMDYVCPAMSSGAEDIGWAWLSIGPPRLATSFNRHRAGAPSPITVAPLRFRGCKNNARLQSILCGGRSHAVTCSTARPASAHGSQPCRRRCRNRRERYNDFRTLIAGGRHRGRLFDEREQRSTGISDLPAPTVA